MTYTIKFRKGNEVKSCPVDAPTEREARLNLVKYFQSKCEILSVFFTRPRPKKRYFRVYNKSRDCYYLTGYNSTSMKELIEDFKGFVQSGRINYEDISLVRTWDDIAGYLNGAELQISSQKFEPHPIYQH